MSDVAREMRREIDAQLWGPRFVAASTLDTIERIIAAKLAEVPERVAERLHVGLPIRGVPSTDRFHVDHIHEAVREVLGLSAQGVAQAERPASLEDRQATPEATSSGVTSPPEPAARPTSTSTSGLDYEYGEDAYHRPALKAKRKEVMPSAGIANDDSLPGSATEATAHRPEPELPKWWPRLRDWMRDRAKKGREKKQIELAVVDVEAALRELAELRDKQCHHGWRGVDELGVIRTPCPACGGQLFIGKGGHLTCSVIKCGHDPGIEHYWNDYKTERDKLLTAARELKEAERNPTDQGPQEEADFCAAVDSVCAIVEEIDGE